ncbi:MAG: glycosyltransferase family 1 protein [Sphingobacteriales bacterium]|nr:MAG: glycosyltransferase family 1 protein [Sphingobacteriales bacterium]
MRIAFDAKRAFENPTGLGHGCRTLITELAQEFPQHEYYLMAPKKTSLFKTSQWPFVHPVFPSGIAGLFGSLWRSNWVKNDLKKLNIDLYHGWSHEIPVGIQNTGIKTAVTIHDLIFERYPTHYKAPDVAIYRKKFKYSCTHADKIIAVSEQTKRDLIDLYKVPEEKIVVWYQSCDPIYEQKVSEAEMKRIKQKYKLPDQFFLSVGSIIERKNLLTTCKAFNLLKDKMDVPLYIIGKGGAYEAKVRSYIQQNGLQDRVHFFEDEEEIKNDTDYKSSKDFPAIYQQALGTLYPSIFEGFGIPVVEALWSGSPVITSNTSCLPETGGDAAILVNPMSEQEIADALYKIATDATLRQGMIEKGYQHAQLFQSNRVARHMMQIYESVV